MRKPHSILAALALLAAACVGSNGGGSSPNASPQGSGSQGRGSVSAPSPSLSRVRLKAASIGDLDGPLAMATRKGDDALYFAQQVGLVMAIRGGTLDPTPVLDIRSTVSSGGERGLLGLAFSPNGAFLYVDFTDLAGDTRVVEFRMRGGRVEGGSARQVLFVDQPFSNHNGGEVIFGPDGYLYVGLGDGGSEGDPQDNSQSLSTLLGKLLRIDPRPQGGKSYGIPPDNPFVGKPGARPEIWAYGLRNPWRFSFDRQSGDLWIGDVGGSQREEVDYQPVASKGGENYGWNRMEGSLSVQGQPPPDAVLPVFEYSHEGGGCVVTGGYVYRGADIPNLVGSYVFADFCLGRLTALRLKDGKVVGDRSFDVTIPQLSSFGEGKDGELYAISLAGPIYRIEAG
jgi:glucose/arabinose dehydrogenase